MATFICASFLLAMAFFDVTMFVNLLVNSRRSELMAVEQSYVTKLNGRHAHESSQLANRERMLADRGATLRLGEKLQIAALGFGVFAGLAGLLFTNRRRRLEAQ